MEVSGVPVPVSTRFQLIRLMMHLFYWFKKEQKQPFITFERYQPIAILWIWYVYPDPDQVQIVGDQIHDELDQAYDDSGHQ